MKQFFTSILALIIGLSVYANPIETVPGIEISELYFDELNNWKLELMYYDVYTADMIDSIFIQSSTNIVKLPFYDLSYHGNGLLVITADSLDSEFHINRYADSIKLIYYMGGMEFEDILIFGDIPGAYINYPRQGQSISRFGKYSKDNSPTIGDYNDTLGMCGTVKGIIYDIDSVPVKNSKFSLDFNFETSENGEYSARVLSNTSKVNYIKYHPGIHITQSVPIQEFSYIMEPDSIIELDIYLLEVITEINNINISNTPISIYPNPVSKNDIININIDLPIITSEIYIELIDLSGKMIMKKKINQNLNSITAPNISGVYILRTTLDSQLISSDKIIVYE